MLLLKKLQIGVIGYNSGSTINISDDTLKLAYTIGSEIAKRKAILISGGLGGVMRASCKGARDHKGFAIGIVPQDSPNEANEFCDAVISTGVGLSRDFIVAHSSDGIISVGGGVGTLIELCVGYMTKKPMVAIKGSGGISDIYGGRYLDERKRIEIGYIRDPVKAVDHIVDKLRKD